MKNGLYSNVNSVARSLMDRTARVARKGVLAA